jgi:bla regulator protein BlaR1
MMSLASTLASLERLFEILAAASIAGIVVPLVVWTVCRFARTLAPSTRCALWWLAALKLVVALVWIEPIVLRVLPEQRLTPGLTPTSNIAEVAEPRPVLPVGEQDVMPEASWRAVAGAVWILGVTIAIVELVRQVRRTTRIRRHAAHVDSRVHRAIAQLAPLAGLTRLPAAGVSDEVDAPMVVGLLRPMIVLPANRFSALSVPEQDMALCHELVHLRRRDLWLGCVPALAERLFFFHPLAHLAAREYLVAREAACDREVLRLLDAPPHDYGRLLLTLGVTPMRARFAAAGTSQSFSDLKRRIAMLGHGSPSWPGRMAGWLLAAVAVCALIPIQLVARPSSGPADLAPRHLKAWPWAANAKGSPAIAQSEKAAREKGERFEFVLMTGDRDSVTMSGSSSDARRVMQLRQGNERLFWFRHDGKEFVVRDTAALDEADGIIQPMREIGAKQGEVGAKQGAIGAKQGEVGAKQGNVGARQGAIGAKQGAIGAQQAALATREMRDLSESEKREVEQERKRLDDEMQALDREMQKLNDEMERAGQPMNGLDDQMRVLSEEMDVLSRQMDEASAKADKEMVALAERLIKNGLAQPAP